MNTSIKFILDSKPLADGRYSVYLQVIRDRAKKNIAIGLKCHKSDFQHEKFRKSYRSYKTDNILLTELKAKGNKIIREFELDGIDFTLNEFALKFRGKEYNQNLRVKDLLLEIVEENKTAGKMSSAKAFKDTMNSLLNYASDSVTLKDITPSFLEKYEVYLRSRDNKNGGIAFKMRYLRTLLNTAIRRKIISHKNYPFRDYKISKLKNDNNKKALSLENFRKFRDADVGEHLQWAKDYFLFSVYARGMNFADMASLEWSNIQNCRLLYKRSKTKHSFNIAINSEMKAIIEKYRCRQAYSRYIFPIFLKDDLTPQQKADRHHKVLGNYNKKLKEIQEVAKIDSPITTYVARHSFATILKHSGTSVEKISEMMGHSNVEITNSYLKDFEDGDLDKEADKFLNI